MYAGHLCLVRPRVDLQFNADSAKLLLLGARHHDSRVKALRGGEAAVPRHSVHAERWAARRLPTGTCAWQVRAGAQAHVRGCVKGCSLDNVSADLMTVVLDIDII